MSVAAFQRLLPLLLGVTAFVLPRVAHACPMCFTGNNENADAFLYGSLLLMAVPVLSLGGLAYWAYRRITAADRMSPDADETDATLLAKGAKGAVVLPLVERH